MAYETRTRSAQRSAQRSVQTPPVQTPAQRPAQTLAERPAADEANEAGNEPPPKRTRSRYTRQVKVIVGTGDGQETFFVYENMFCEKSAFFKAACSKSWLENQEKTVRLPEHEAETFRMYIECVYYDQVDFNVLCDLPVQGDGGHEAIDEVGSKRFCNGTLSLCKVWVAADFLGDSGTQNRIADWIVRLFADNPSAKLGWSWIIFVANNTLVQTGLHIWLMDTLQDVLNPSHMEYIVEELPSASVVENLKRLAGRRSAARIDMRHPENRDRYHI